jgi:hypothetical protein
MIHPALAFVIGCVCGLLLAWIAFAEDQDW